MSGSDYNDRRLVSRITICLMGRAGAVPVYPGQESPGEQCLGNVRPHEVMRFRARQTP